MNTPIKSLDEAELDYFARCCTQKKKFCVTHVDGMKALNVCYEGQKQMERNST